MVDARTSALRSGLLLGANWVHQSSAGTREHVNPATGKVQASFPIAGAAEVDAAVRAARAALPAWREWKAADRAKLIRRIADGIRANAAEFGVINALEIGQPNSPRSATAAAEWFDHYAGWVDKLCGDVIPVSTGGFDYTRPEPVGVVASITTWNGPVMSAGMTLAPALAAGCCVVLKPADLTPFSSVLFADVCREAGLPDGVITVVTGDGATGDALVRHPGIDKISFVGGLPTASRIQEASAANVTPLVLELGGKSANIVFADADLDNAVGQATRFTSLSGQGCTLPTRLLVQSSIYDEFVPRVVERLKTIVLGDPFDPATTMGPVASKAQCERIIGMIERAKAAGGRILLGGERLGGELAEGFFIPPTVIDSVAVDSELAQDEVFGPVLTVFRFEDEREAVQIANATDFALAAYAHTSDLGRAMRLVKALHAGSVHINGSGPGAISPASPFGGFGRSGYGKQGGKEGIMEFVNLKNVHITT